MPTTVRFHKLQVPVSIMIQHFNLGGFASFNVLVFNKLLDVYGFNRKPTFIFTGVHIAVGCVYLTLCQVAVF